MAERDPKRHLGYRLAHSTPEEIFAAMEKSAELDRTVYKEFMDIIYGDGIFIPELQQTWRGDDADWPDIAQKLAAYYESNPRDSAEHDSEAGPELPIEDEHVPDCYAEDGTPMWFGYPREEDKDGRAKYARGKAVSDPKTDADKS